VLAQGPQSLPAYAQVTLAGQSHWTWAAGTADPRGLDRPDGGDRLAACWYSHTAFTVDVTVTDGRDHAVALYVVDWNRAGAGERIDVLDAATGAVLDTRTADAFGGGRYLVWTVRGAVRFRITNTGAENALLSALFFG
jgi:hypothetical protein